MAPVANQPGRVLVKMKSFVMLILLICTSVNAGDVTYIYTDPQGTPLLETDSTGKIIGSYDYRPYGSQILGTAQSGPGYTGHVNDPDTNLIYMQARYYDPVVGRFLSIDPDPVRPGEIHGHNRYVYAQNAPLSHTDPSGRCIEDFCIGEAILAFEGIEYLIASMEAGEVVAAEGTVAVAAEGAAASSATVTAGATASGATLGTGALAETAAQCAANTTCTALAATTATAIAVKTVQAVQQTATTQQAAEHTKNARPSSKGRHEKGNSRRKQDAGNEKGDSSRRPSNKRPPNHRGPWPPKPEVPK